MLHRLERAAIERRNPVRLAARWQRADPPTAITRRLAAYWRRQAGLEGRN